jgi:hypothetical protein
MPICSPQFELGVAVHADLEQIILASIVKLELGHDLRVAAFQTFRQTEQRGQHPDHPPIGALQIAKPFV